MRECQIENKSPKNSEDDDDILQDDIKDLTKDKDLPTLPPIAAEQTGRILFLYETGDFAVIEFKQKLQKTNGTW